MENIKYNNKSYAYCNVCFKLTTHYYFKNDGWYCKECNLEYLEKEYVNDYK